ncbi:HAMP domain-containing histidine kinase [Sphingobacterium sp. SGG-5]|uniref:hybrid sensor histidine kinase/response regulator n=1 Tax=Sphingobacterium sp. SGG-5 TaxID=2710881 RepID=UPI0013EB46C6|nr:hybrid sensor histidine kinase/response regulator [Sphingobacterium sp. SGG-5]NGM61988.1 HAMP domain-containing histidine kinase [Sphingobacterium sp. SGG-5]
MQKELEVLYIDDEINNLVGFKANFRYSYVVHTASSTIEAQEILAAHPDIRVIFCDQRMPGELGIDFLHRIKKEFPRPIRILLTAYADMETVIDAVNKGHIFRFVRKPWQEEDIISSIQEANKFYIASSLLDIRNEELQKAYDELDKFAYSVSHDLRDPLSGVQSAIKLALEFDKIEDVRELLKLMDDSLSRLDAYIDSLRDYYLLRRGELTLSEIDFHQLFESIRQFYKMSTQHNDVTFETHVEQTEVFKGDKAVLELILHNLLSNAFKYQQIDSDNKRVNLSVTVANGYAKIVITDTGIGISADHIDDIFKLFFRGSDQAKGMGFGLYNVQSALLKLKGTINVTSQIGEGTTFTIALPSK